MTRWVLRKFKEEGIGDGMRFFDAEGLRVELGRRVGLEWRRGAAEAALAVKAAARDEGGAAARDAGGVAEACDALARAGWHLGQLGLEEGMGRRVRRSLERAGGVAGIFDRRVAERLAELDVRLCCFAGDATHWPDLGLLGMAAAHSRDLEMYVPSPRLPADELQREWIEALEERLGLERATCPESGFASENETLVARLERSGIDSRKEAHAPGLLVGREWADEVGLVCGQVRTWLEEGAAAAGPIGVIGPEDSAAAVAVAEGLEKAGVRVEHRGRKREPGGVYLILEQVARYHLAGHDIEELIELARLLWVSRREEGWEALEPMAVRAALDYAFQAAQSRNGRILARTLPGRRDAVWAAVRGLVEALGRWEGDFEWPALCEKWAALLAGMRLPADAVALPGGLFEQERLPGRAFMEWVAEELEARRRLDVAPPDYAALAPVVVTTFADAAQQTWERLIFLDSNEHVWPAPILENPFLTDAARAGLNRNRKESARLLTTRDLRALEQARFLDLVEHCRGGIAFAGVLLEQSEAGDRAQPNEWVLRALLETAEPEEAYPPGRWEASARRVEPEAPPALEEAERAHLEMVHGSRRNGTMPFDRYQFNYHETKLEPGAWSATALDEAITCPATFALRELFGAEACEGFARAEGAAVGNRAHAWLGRILGLRDRLARPGPASGDEAKLARECATARRELEEWYGAEELDVPLWWEGTLRKTEWATRRCLREVRGWLEGRYCAMEQKLAVTVRTPAGPLMLKGRIDVLISDGPELEGARVRIFDFKTGRSAAPALATMANGQGAQFGAYYLMARDAGAVEAVIGIIKPEAQARDVFAARG